MLFSMFAILPQFAESQSNLKHFYIKIDGSDYTNFKLEFGRISYNKKYAPKREADPNIDSMDSLIAILYENLAQENTSDKLNIFIHGIWADTRFAWEEMVQNVSRDIYGSEDNKQNVLLSIIWSSALEYKKGVEIARRKGDYLSQFLKNLLYSNNNNYKINFLCHSMGNRVFQHMINESDLIDTGKKIIDQFVSVGADIESNTFEDGEPLHGLEHLVNDITIYMHNNDRTLGMSRLLNSSDRLGLNGVPDITALADNFRTIDVSIITDHDDLSSKIGNHRYFYMSPSVRKDIKRVLFEKDFITSKKPMKHSRRLKLLPDQEK